MGKRLGIYIHIPFCASKCSYCDFYSLSGCDYLMPEYHEALLDHLIRANKDSLIFLPAKGSKPAGVEAKKGTQLSWDGSSFVLADGGAAADSASDSSDSDDEEIPLPMDEEAALTDFELDVEADLDDFEG